MNKDEITMSKEAYYEALNAAQESGKRMGYAQGRDETARDILQRLWEERNALGQLMVLETDLTKLAKEYNIELEKNLMEALKQAEFIVDKEELFKALNYDRDQYEKGFADGFDAGKKAVAQYYLDEAYLRIIDLKENIDDAVKTLNDIANADGLKLGY